MRFSRGFTALLVLLVVESFISCPKPDDDSENGDSTYPSDLVGTWYLTWGDTYSQITTNSDQTALIPFLAGTGSIDVSGELSTSLKFITATYIDEDAGRIGVSISSQAMFEAPVFPNYALLVFLDANGSGRGTFLAIDMNGYSTYVADSAAITYAVLTHTLSMNPTDFVKVDGNGVADSSAIVTLSGSLGANTVLLDAETPTAVSYGINPFEFVTEYTLILDSDGNWQNLISESYGDDLYRDTSSGM